MPNTIADNLQRLVDARTAIASAITAKGGSVTSGDGFEEFPVDIASIPANVEHYGLKWEKNNSDPQARCTYLYDCANFTPMQCQSDGTVSLGSWGNSFFVKNNYPAMVKPDGTIDYKLDPTDHTKDLDGNDSHITDHATDNAMAIFDCHIWMKWYEDETYQYVEIANSKLDDDFHDYPYIREDGTVNDKLFYPMYEGTIDTNGKLRSLSGSKPQSNLEGGATAEQAAAHLNGTNWQIGDWAHHLLFTLLCMMVGKSTCPELALGEGNTNGGSDATGFCTNGECNTRGQFWGKPRSATNAENNQPCKAFYVENYQANRWKRTLGFYNINGTYYVKMVPPFTTDETYANYTNCGAVPSASGWLKDLNVNSCGFMVSSVGSPASATTYQGAYFYPKNSQKNLLLIGGYCGYGADCGLWCLRVYYRASSRLWFIGASLYLR